MSATASAPRKTGTPSPAQQAIMPKISAWRNRQIQAWDMGMQKMSHNWQNRHNEHGALWAIICNICRFAITCFNWVIAPFQKEENYLQNIASTVIGMELPSLSKTEKEQLGSAAIGIGLADIPEPNTITDGDIATQKELESQIDISQEMLEKIKELIPEVSRRSQENTNIIWFSSNNLIFRFKKTPKLIFKIQKMYDISTEERFANMVKAKKVCDENRLDRLVIPHAKKIELEISGKKITLIAEEYVITDKKSIDITDEILRQLVIFIAKTKFNKVEADNLLILNDGRIAIVDFESMGNAALGIIGLIHTYAQSKAQLDFIIKEAEKYDIKIPEAMVKEILKEKNFIEIGS